MNISNSFFDLLKMKFLFFNDNNILSAIFTFITITLLSNNVLLNFINKISIKHFIWSLIMKENKIYIDGKRYFINGPFSRRHENIFSMSFNAIWQYVAKILK